MVGDDRVVVGDDGEEGETDGPGEWEAVSSVAVRASMCSNYPQF